MTHQYYFCVCILKVLKMALKYLECIYIPMFLCTLIPHMEDIEANQMFIDINVEYTGI